MTVQEIEGSLHNSLILDCDSFNSVPFEVLIFLLFVVKSIAYDFLTL